jgi:hypothetical protein
MKSKVQVELMRLCLFFFDTRPTQSHFLLQRGWLMNLHLYMFMGAQFFIKGWYYFWMHLYNIKNINLQRKYIQNSCVQCWNKVNAIITKPFGTFLFMYKYMGYKPHRPLWHHVNPSFLIHRETNTSFFTSIFLQN